MLNYIIIFLVLAIISSIFGFSGLASDFAGIAKFLTGLFIILFVASVVYSIVTGRSSSPPL